MEALKGIYFFNSGPNSGAIEKHKHIEVLPADVFKLPIIT
jgi:ATP adenylyltransferase/5',5'''-P-1,P-4-tetraphosphate phosphorylase II